MTDQSADIIFNAMLVLDQDCGASEKMAMYLRLTGIKGRGGFNRAVREIRQQFHLNRKQATRVVRAFDQAINKAETEGIIRP